MAEERLHIRLHLYDTDMAVVVNRDEEIHYRNAAKLINDTVNTYSNILKGRKSEKEILYAAMLVIALEYEKNKDNNDTSEYDGILEKLTQEIEAALKWFTVPAGMERTEYVSYINNIKEQKWF